MAWQDYVNEKYSKKKQEQETTKSASPSAASGSNAEKLATLTAQVNQQRRAEAGTWQNHVNQRYGSQTAAQRTQAQDRQRWAARQVRGLYNAQQARADAVEALRQRVGLSGLPTTNQTIRATGGARVGGTEESAQPITGRTAAVAARQAAYERQQARIEAAERLKQHTGIDPRPEQSYVRVNAESVPYAARAAAVSAMRNAPENETIQQQTREVQEAKPTPEAMERKRTWDEYIQSQIDQRAGREQTDGMRNKLQGIGKLAGIVGDAVSGAAQDFANNGAAQNTLRAVEGAGSALARLWGEVNRRQAENAAGAVARYDEAYPTVGDAKAPGDLRDAYLDAWKAYTGYEGGETHSLLMDPTERSGHMSERLDMLLNELSHPEEVDLYYEDNGPGWALGTDRQQARERELKTLQADAMAAQADRQTVRDEWSGLKGLPATDPQALEAMRAAGGDYAAAAEAYLRAVEENAASKDQQARQAELGIPGGPELIIVDGRIVDASAMQGPRMSAENALSDAETNLTAKYRELQRTAVSEADERAQQAQRAFEDAQEALREAWNEDYEREAASEYDRLRLEYEEAYGRYLTAKQESYVAGREAAQEEAATAPERMRTYYRMLPYYEDFEENKEGPYKNDVETELAYAQRAEDPQFQELFLQMSRMSQQQIDIMNYLYNTRGEHAAREYMESIKPELNRQLRQETEAAARQFGEEHPVLATLLHPVRNLENTRLGGRYIAGQLGEALLTGKDMQLDANSPYFGSGVARDAMSQGATSHFGDGWLGKVGTFLYNAGLSAVESGRLGGALFGGAGTVVMGAGTMVDSTRDVLERGGNNAQALAVGGIKGGLEILTEHMGAEKLMDLFDLSDGQSIIKEIAKNVGSEALEEITSEGFGLLADYFLMGDKGEYQAKVAEYRQAGMSQKAAEDKAQVDMAMQVVMAGAGGAFGGLLLGGGSAALGKAYNGIANAVVKSDIDKLGKAWGAAESVFKTNWDGGTMPGVYDAAFEALYNGGREGMDIEAIREAAPGIVGTLSEAKQQTIYTAGQNAAAAEAQGETAARVGEDEAAVMPREQTGRDQLLGVTQEEATARVGGDEETVMPMERTGRDELVRAAREEAQPVVAETDEGIGQTQAQVEAEEAWQERTEEQRAAARYEREVVPGVVRQYSEQKLSHDQRGQMRVLDELGKHYGVEFDIVDSLAGGRANGVYAQGKRFVVALDAADQAYVQTGAHEMVHYIKAQDADAYAVLEKLVTDTLEQTEGYELGNEIKARIAEYRRNGQAITEAEALEEIVAEAVPTIFSDRAAVRELVAQNRSLAEKIRDFIMDFVDTLRGIAVNYMADSDRMEMAALLGETETLTNIARSFDAALERAGEAYETRQAQARETARESEDGDALAASVRSTGAVAQRVRAEERGAVISQDNSTAYLDTTKYSFRSLYEGDYGKDKEGTAKLLAQAVGVPYSQALRYVNNMHSIAAMIAGDRERLDYEPERIYSALKSNSEYIWTVDFSTLCKKRLQFTGTFDAIQKQMPDVIMTENDVIKLRNMMAEKGYEVACAFCYVESRRKDNGKIINQFLKKYQAAMKGDGVMHLGPRNRLKNFNVEPGFMPTIANFNTTEGYTEILHNHPQVYEAYMYFMNARGTSKPKLIETMTDYQHEIQEQFRNPRAVESMNARGGLRLQSFSDFQTINLLDMMQVITDMSRVGLKGQAYTKVPAFARVFGGTGLKINLSLVAKGVDEKGRLVFDDVEGMPHDEAFAIRKKHSANVGTILVAGNDDVIRAAMKDPRIDFIIPYHRSGWTRANERQLGLDAYDNYTKWQNERDAATGRKAKENIFPAQYWDYDLSGDENAARYLEICRENGVRPKFEQFAGEPGYWKMLIDFKMYDNDGKGSPQLPVRPDINMREATRLMREYDGKGNDLPVAQDVVDEFVAMKRAEMAENAGDATASLKNQVRFSMKAPVERKGELVAVHNLDDDGLRMLLRLGGIPMASTAIIKAEQGHTMYGRNSIVFFASAIDPKANPYNKVYGADAWTPTKQNASIEREINSRIVYDLHSDIDKTVMTVGPELANETRRFFNDLEHRDYTYESMDDLESKAWHNPGMLAAYQLENNEEVKPVQRVEFDAAGYKADRTDIYDGFLDALIKNGKIRSFRENIMDMSENEILDEYGEIYSNSSERAAKYWGIFKTKGGAMARRSILNQIMESLFYLEDGRGKASQKTVTDWFETAHELQNKIDREEFRKWIRSTFGEVFGEVGVRNSLDDFDYNGNRRTFKQTHYPLTAENIVKAMRMAKEKGGYARGATGLIATSSKEYNSLDEIRKDADRLGAVSEEEYKKILKGIDDRLYDFQGWVGESGIEALYDAARQIAKGRDEKIALTTAFDTAKIKLTPELRAKALQLIYDAQNVPTGYFEAKPQRVQKFDEVAAVIMQEGTDETLVNAVKSAGMRILFYTDVYSRLNALNSIDQPGVRFSLNNTSTEPVDTVRVLAGIDGRPTIRISGVGAAAQETGQRTAGQAAERAGQAAQRGQAQAMKLARQVLKEYGSTYSRGALRDNMLALTEEIAKNGVSDDTLREATQLARAVIEHSRRVDTTLRDQYSDLRRTLRETPVTLTETQRQEAANIAGDYGAFRRSVFGTFNLAKEGKSLDAIWSEWSDMAPDLFPPETVEGDMVQRLVDVRAAFMPKVDNPYGMDMDGASTDLGLRMQEEILKAIGDEAGAVEMRGAVDELRRQYMDAMRDERLRVKRMQREAFDRIADALKAARGSGDREAANRAMTAYRAQLKRIGAEQAEAQARLAYRLSYEDRTARAEAYERIRKYAENLRRMLAKPDKNKHVPVALQADLMNVLSAIDFKRGGRETAGTLAWKQSLDAISDFLAKQLDIQTNNKTDSAHVGIWMSLCEPVLERLKESMAVVRRTNKPIANMSLEEINAFSNAMSIIQHSVNSINTAWLNERHETMDALGEATLRDMRGIRDNRAQNSNAAVRMLDNMLNIENLDAGSFMQRLGGRNGAAYSVYEELRKGQSEAYARVREASEAAPEILGFTDDNRRTRTQTIRNWASEAHTFEIPMIREGEAKLEQLTMTGTQLMELYALSRRPQARQHILTGGIRVAGSDGKLGDTRTWKVTEEQLDHMLDELTDDQKQTAQRMQAYLSGTVSEWGNEVTEKMYLYRMFGEENYWPIRSERSFMRTKEQNGSVLFNALTNAGFTKQTQEVVRNPIVVSDAIETFSGHVSDMATFSGLAMPVDDFLRWYNYASRDENGHVEYTDSVKKQIERTVGKGGLGYIQNLMDDLNGMGKKAPESELVGWMTGNYKRAAIMGKLRVVVQQPTAILRASAMIDPKYFTGVTNGVGRNTTNEMQAHSALAWWKSNGNYEIGTGQSMKSIIIGMQDSAKDDVFEALNKPAGKADDLGWATIWQAVKKETAAEHKDLEVGSEEYWDHVVERFEDVCMNTQVVDTVLTRSAMMRSRSALQKMATAFMSEPTKNFNLMRTAASELYAAIRSGDAEARKRATGKVIRSTAAITAATALNAVMTAVFDALRYYNPDDEDEWGEQQTFWDAVGMNWMEDFGENMNPLTNIPYVKDIYAIMTGGDVERMDMSAVSRLYTAADKAWKYATEGNPNSYTTWAALKPLITGVGDMAGLPVSGLVANAELVINAAQPGVIRTKLETATSAGAYDALYKAIAGGDTKKAEQLRAELRRGTGGRAGKTSADIDTGVAKVLALQDDRIREYWEKRESGRTAGLKDLKRAIMADGFSEEIVMKAVNSYQSVVKSDAKAYYLQAVEQGRTDKAEEFAAKLRDAGVTDQEMAKWTEPAADDEQLEMTAEYTKKNLYAAIRNGDATSAEIMDIMESLRDSSEAEDPMSGIRSGLSSEFKQEYMDLIRAGKTSQAAKLRKRLEDAGAKSSTIDGWEKEARKK